MNMCEVVSSLTMSDTWNVSIVEAMTVLLLLPILIGAGAKGRGLKLMTISLLLYATLAILLLTLVCCPVKVGLNFGFKPTFLL